MPEILVFEAKFSNTRNVALPLTARFAAPGPEIVTLWFTASSPLVRVMVPETPVASMVSPSFAMLSALRNDPEPLSLVFVTTMVVACAEIAAAKSNAAAMVTDLMVAVILFFI